LTKEEIRKKILSHRFKMSRGEVMAKSEVICGYLISSKQFREAKIISLYSPIKKEVRTQDIFNAARSKGKIVGFPVSDIKKNEITYFEVDDVSELIEGAYGIMEPPSDKKRMINAPDINLIIIPGVAFDDRGFRIGYGGGYFDRLLGRDDIKATKTALAFDLQMVSRIPEESHDMRLDFIFTESRKIECPLSNLPSTKEVHETC
jgi:5-formyltetrahydrofolate cyclo-ligase